MVDVPLQILEVKRWSDQR